MGKMELHAHTPVNFTIDEDSHRTGVAPNEGMPGKYISQRQSEIGNNSIFTPLSYMSNYISVSSPLFTKDLKKRIRIENEDLLKRYYSSKKSISHAMYRHGSIASDSETSNVLNERSRSYVWMNKFLDDSRYLATLFEPDATPEVHLSSEEEGEWEKRQALRTHAASPYFKHFQRLLAVDLREPDVLKKHNLWIPMIKRGWRNTFSIDQEEEDSLYDGKVSPLFIDGNEYMTKDYDLYKGSTSIPSIFSEYRLPALVHHCAVELNGKVYILGGLMACHKHDDEAPSLRDFVVDGIKNLPPPLLSSVVNNPCMINNGRLYVMSAYSNSLRRPEVSGQIPPPLLCMKGSKLTERHIFFYGGFEIRTETNIGENGVFHLRKRAYMNNTGYILDTMTFNFTRVELTAVPYKLVSYPTLAARFGHVQLSISNNGNNTHNNSNGSYFNHQRHHENDENGDGSPASGFESTSSEANSPAVSVGSTPARLNNALHNSGVHSILIFGGYKQTGDDDYEALNDLWKIDVPVLVKGKRGYYKFGSTANATILPRSSPRDPWPSPRAFPADCVTNVRDNATKPDLLERLQENFFIDKSTFPAQDKSRPLFKSLPHARSEPDRSKILTRTKESGTSSTSSTTGSTNASTNPLLKQCLTSSSSHSAPTKPLQPRSKTQPNFEHKVLIMHGGSNKTDVCRDMWWYDIETETWSQITTHGKHEASKMIPIGVGLVGHSLVCVGGMAVFVGGLLQEDVDFLYHGVDYEDMRIPPQLAIGSDFINLFDLATQCLLGHTVIGDETNAYLRDDLEARLGVILSCGFTVIQFNGDILLFGGVVSRRFETSGLNLRGAVLKCVLPSMKLAI
ncbi:ZYRO0C00550p [Zygosaccharomyces rouxii]|uniref:ZYRO0C00550p n=1 Tax=Zygosaccharomyces rouxii (strain ATCC 2623 / CBS 732 / NBRC 1130 / NCYC 568 / NRRL Y-229) TaxID=559307 RepID=C5DSJ1_ZYGRC|nr:uncharacterized protein ZYRO0C00550g [Zygosaccharomyces rouxii]KAH9202059.1 hypothetical protein LQ764DRAFT_92638 [Zygosaccharomyces rouxii]CAR26752.1 ZYRO0C00550p [Zygosaccharomyces rouxii]